MPVSKSKRNVKHMSAKQKQERKALNRIRGAYCRSNMSQDEARMIYKALKDKTPAPVMLAQVKDGVMSTLDQFVMIDNLANYAEGYNMMDVIKTAKPSLHESVTKAKEYLDGVRKQVNELYVAKSEELKGMDAEVAMLSSHAIVEIFDEILTEVQENSFTLMETIKQIHLFHQEVAHLAQVEGIDNDR